MKTDAYVNWLRRMFIMERYPWGINYLMFILHFPHPFMS